MLKILRQAEEILLVIFTVLLTADVLLGILARYIHIEVVFANEVGKYLFIWLCLIGVSAAARDNQHVRLSFIVERLPFSRGVTWILSQALFLAFSLLMCYWGFQLMLMHVSMNTSAMGFVFPMYVFTAAVPVGFGLTSIRLMADIIQVARGSTPWIISAGGTAEQTYDTEN